MSTTPSCGCSLPSVLPPNLGTGICPVPAATASAAPVANAPAWAGPPVFPRPPKIMSLLLDVAKTTSAECEAPGHCGCQDACDCSGGGSGVAQLARAQAGGATLNSGEFSYRQGSTGPVAYPLDGLNRAAAEIADLQARLEPRFPGSGTGPARIDPATGNLSLGLSVPGPVPSIPSPS